MQSAAQPGKARLNWLLQATCARKAPPCDQQRCEHGLIAGARHMGPITDVAEVNSRTGIFLGALAAPEVSVAALRGAAAGRPIAGLISLPWSLADPVRG